MSEVLDGYFYTSEHEWLRLDDDGTVVVGITDHAQEALGELVFVEVPEASASFASGDACAVVESVKAASDIYAPIGGTITEVNEVLEDEPEIINEDAENKGWIFKLNGVDASALESLMSADQYAEFIK